MFFYVHSDFQSSTFYKNNSVGCCLSDCLHQFHQSIFDTTHHKWSPHLYLKLQKVDPTYS